MTPGTLIINATMSLAVGFGAVEFVRYLNKHYQKNTSF